MAPNTPPSGYFNQTYTLEFEVPGNLDGVTFSPLVTAPSSLNDDPQQIYRPEVEENLGLITPNYEVEDDLSRRGAEGARYVSQLWLDSPVAGSTGALLDIVDAVDGPPVQQELLNDLSGLSQLFRNEEPFIIPQGSLLRISGFDNNTATPIKLRLTLFFLTSTGLLWAQQAICGCNNSDGLQTLIEVDASRSLRGSDLGALLLVDPGGGTVTLTLPAGTVPGFFAEIVQVGTGTVDFVGGGGAVVNSTVGATPAISAQWAGATVVKSSTTDWIVNGSLA